MFEKLTLQRITEELGKLLLSAKTEKQFQKLQSLKTASLLA